MRWRRRQPAPAVSIVVATHNRARLLKLAVDSALAQRYENLEVLVMDDGSTDQTRDLLADYERRNPPERFRFETHANMGQARTLNRGYELARGELLAYLSDDDLLAPKLVPTLVRALSRQPDAAAAYPGYRLIDPEGSIVDTWMPLRYTRATALSHHDTIIGPGGLARRTALEASGAWDPTYRWMGDLIMWMGVAGTGPVLRVEKTLASWRKHPESATTTIGAERAAEHLRLFEHGLTLDPQTADDPALRAEALRNACIVAAWFAPIREFAPGDPISMIDQDRPLVSAWASGQDPATDRFDLAYAERVTSALRQLGELTLQLAEVRDADSGPGAGYERAVQRLRAVGGLAGPDGKRSRLDAEALAPALVAAAVDCAADVPGTRRRYLLPDRAQSAAVAGELRALERLTVSGPTRGREMLDDIRREASQRRADLAGAQVRAR